MAQRKSTPSGGSGGKASGSAGSRPGGKPGASKSGASKSGASKSGAAKGGASRSGSAASASRNGGSAAKGTADKGTADKGTAASTPVAKVNTSKPSVSARSTAPAKAAAAWGPAQRPPARRKKKSIVNQKQTPWGLIISAIVVVAFAAVVVGVVVATHKSTPASKKVASDKSCTKMIGNNPSTYLNELVCAKDIPGVTFKKEANRNHVTGLVKYDSTPPVGGNHNGFWADCTGTVYSQAIANENAVHMLEHGAVWITYNADTLPSSQLTELKAYVSGNDRLALSPYPNLKSPISLQAWGYQLFVKKASDPRIARFIAALKYNQRTTPEPGASCSNPGFKANPSTFGHPTSS